MRAIGSPQCKIQKIRTHKKSRNHQIPGFEVAGYQDLYFAVQDHFLKLWNGWNRRTIGDSST
uniref:Uncharacterized protein n=1 Tax=Helianthus annuus TaxID=4232 RepID=A0A251TR98_HELAN